MTEEEIKHHAKELIKLGNETTIVKYCLKNNIDEDLIKYCLYYKIKNTDPQLYSEFRNRKKIAERNRQIIQENAWGYGKFCSAIQWAKRCDKNLYKRYCNSRIYSKEKNKKIDPLIEMVKLFLDEYEQKHISIKEFYNDNKLNRISKVRFLEFVFLELEYIDEQLFAKVKQAIQQKNIEQPKLSISFILLQQFIEQKTKNKNLTVADFCKEKKANHKTFYKYVGKLKKKQPTPDILTEYMRVMQ